jgi:hypothetical protein
MLAVPLAAIALNRGGPFERTWLYLLPLFLIHAGAGLAYAAELLTARVPRAGLATGLGAVALAAGLGAAAVDHGETDPTQLPSSDNHIVGFLKRSLRPGEPAVLDPASVGPASLYYLARYGYSPPQLPGDGSATDALLVVTRRAGGRAGVGRLVRSINWRLVGPRAPRLVARREYVEAWEARIERLPGKRTVLL